MKKNKNLVILGAGGHARPILEILGENFPSNKKIILQFLDNGQGRKVMQERLKEEEFQKLYLSIIKNEASLYQAFEERYAIQRKNTPRKKPFPKVYILAALSVLSFGLIYFINQRVAYHENGQTWHFSGSSINSEKSTSYTLFDGSKLSFKSPSSVIFLDKNNIQINKGLLEAKIVPRKNN